MTCITLLNMIKSFKDKGLRRFSEKGDASRLSVQKTGRIAEILRLLEVATRPADLNIPGYRFHELAPRYPGTFSVLVSGNYRITFSWEDQDAIDVDLLDYH